MTTPAPANELPPVITTIDGHTYQLSPLPSWQNLEAFHTVLKLAGPAIAQLATIAGKTETDANQVALAIGALGDAVSRTLMTVPPAEVRALTAKLFTGCLVTMQNHETGETKQVSLMSIFDLHFQRRLLSMFKLLAFAIDVNYADFTSGLKVLGAKLAKKLEQGQQGSPDAPVIESKTNG